MKEIWYEVERRKNDRRISDQDLKIRIRHCAKRLAKIRGILNGKLELTEVRKIVDLFNDEVDAFLDLAGLINVDQESI